jgi:DNA polymerase IV
LETVSATAKRLLAATGIDDVKIRLLGISLSNFNEVVIKAREEKPTDQLTLFPTVE